jgi:hypothetical protein
MNQKDEKFKQNEKREREDHSSVKYEIVSLNRVPAISSQA